MKALVEVSIFDMTPGELEAEARRREETGEIGHARELRAFSHLRARAIAAYPDLNVESAMRRLQAAEVAS